MGVFAAKARDNAVNARELAHRVDQQLEEVLRLAAEKPGLAMVEARKAAEGIVKEILRREQAEGDPSVELGTLIDRVTKCKRDGSRIVPKLVETELRVVQHYGNLAAHDQGGDQAPRPSQARAAGNALAEVAEWYAFSYLGLARAETAKKAPRKRRGKGRPGLGERGRFVREIKKRSPPLWADPETTLHKANRTLQVMLQRISEFEGISIDDDPDAAQLLARVRASPAVGMPERVATALDVVRTHGTKIDGPSASDDDPSDEDAEAVKANLDVAVNWYLRDYLGAWEVPWGKIVIISLAIILIVLRAKRLI
jgi:hypothetical protein